MLNPAIRSSSPRLFAFLTVLGCLLAGAHLFPAVAGAENNMAHYFPNGVIKGMCYQPVPTDFFSPDTPVKYGNTDFYNSDFEALWSTDGKGKTRTVHFPDGSSKNQGDLHTLKDMGANLIRIYGWQGHAGWVDHSVFLDACDQLGIKVIVPLALVEKSNPAYNIYYENVASIIAETYNHSSVAFYSVGNEINPGSQSDVFDAIKDIAQHARDLLDSTYPGKQMIISPTWGSDEAMGWFYDAKTGEKKVAIDAWAFNVYDTVALGKILAEVSNKTLHGMPVLLSEYGMDAYNSSTNLQDPALQVSSAEPLVDLLYANTDKIYGGCWFEFSDERNKGLSHDAGGGGKDKTATASTYLPQVGGSYYTYEDGATAKIPSSDVGTCTYGWKSSAAGDGVMNEGYFGMGYMADTGKTALTVKNGASVSGKTIPWVYRVDDLHLREIYTTLKNAWAKHP